MHGPLVLTLLLLAATAAAAQPARVIDGDTLELSTGERIRLWGIDAPEGDQVCQQNGQPWECGDDATSALRTLLDGAEVTCTEVDRDRYGRLARSERPDESTPAWTSLA